MPLVSNQQSSMTLKTLLMQKRIICEVAVCVFVIQGVISWIRFPNWSRPVILMRNSTAVGKAAKLTAQMNRIGVCGTAITGFHALLDDRRRLVPQPPVPTPVGVPISVPTDAMMPSRERWTTTLRVEFRIPLATWICSSVTPTPCAFGPASCWYDILSWCPYSLHRGRASPEQAAETAAAPVFG